MPLIIDVVTGARPNFMKAAALFAVANDFPSLQLRLIHTGQHYDLTMSDAFFKDLKLPKPACHLGVGSGTHGAQSANIMMGYEKWAVKNRPDMCIVVGDVNSTVACALVAAKLGITVAHVEAGLRSFDRTMPEEINRVVTDSISDLLFATEPPGVINLAREGRPSEAIYLVGNVMIDTLLRLRPKAEKLHYYRKSDVTIKEYTYLTLHRPSNVDDGQVLRGICDQLSWLASQMPVIFPVHPRTRKRLESQGLYAKLKAVRDIHLVDPISYVESLSLILNAKVVVTDSGGIQEENTVLGIPCLTLRLVMDIADGRYPRQACSIPYWDGQSGRRVLNIICGRHGVLESDNGL